MQKIPYNCPSKFFFIVFEKFFTLLIIVNFLHCQNRPKFRNYNPSDESLKENSLPKARPENGMIIDLENID